MFTFFIQFCSFIFLIISNLYYLYKYSIIIIFFICLHFSFLNNWKFKVCICTVAKYENKYIMEFIDYYKKIGVDKVYLYDNNDINGENFDFLYNDISSGFIEIINYRGKKRPQRKIYNECYTKNKKIYKWLIFIDLDEYIVLKNYSDIHNYLSQKIFIKCDSIYLNWAIHTDNNLFYYDNRSLKERFPKVNKDLNFCLGKSIVKSNNKNIHIKSVHTLDNNLKICNGFGKIFKPKKSFCIVPDYETNFIDHYQHKSTEEFVEKLKLKGDCIYRNNMTIKYKKIFVYFKDNIITNKKIKYISKNLHLNSSYLKEYLKLKINFNF